MHLLECDTSSSYLLENRVSARCPHEWFGVVVVGSEVVLDRGDELGHACEHAATDGFVGEISEPPLD